eukprot:TRINITY_DN5817_c0_g1_i3.p1 TRINITY_DN5817_c0_g1~~TRINITY_DN5817_c0_g1_i3.p1  ORF type:complete len:207 (+),score=16.41 TRINITY_DN5817_c0_g1_i3:48-668(+)
MDALQNDFEPIQAVNFPSDLLAKYTSNPDLEPYNNVPLQSGEWSDPDVRYALGIRGVSYSKGRAHTKVFWNKKENKLVGLVYFSYDCEGPPGRVHGGCIATILDKCLGLLTQRGIGFGFATVNLNVNYRKFIPLGSTAELECKIIKLEKEGKKAFVEGKFFMDGKVHSEATGIFYSKKVLPYEHFHKFAQELKTKEQILEVLKKTK